MTIYHIAYRMPDGIHLARIRERSIGLAKQRLSTLEREVIDMQRVGGLWVIQNLPGVGYKIEIV